MTRLWKGMRFALGLLALSSIAACVGTVGDAEPSRGTFALDGIILDIEPDGEIDSRIWMEAPQSCEGRLETLEDWALHYAEDAPSLGVVVDENGDPICVDTWGAIREELRQAMGDPSPDPMLPTLDER